MFGLAGVDRRPREEYELKSTVRFASGRIELPTRSETFTADLVEEVRFGPEREVAEPLERGLFRVVRFLAAGGVTTYRFTFEQSFALSDGRALELRLVSPFEFEAGEDGPIEDTLVLPEDFFVSRPANEPLVGSLDGVPLVRYGDCRYEVLPRWRTEVTVAGGTSLSFLERFLPGENVLDTEPASLVWAEVVIDGRRRVVTDYWSLVYSAFRHNALIRYWVVLDPPARAPGIDAPVKFIELAHADPVAGTDARVRYLGEDFAVVGEPTIVSAVRERLGPGPEVDFVRGDVSADGTINVTDAARLLAFLFQGGIAPECRKAADVDDSGSVSVTDAVRILLHLFSGGSPLPAPFAGCGVDPSPDELTCESFAPCP